MRASLAGTVLADSHDTVLADAAWTYRWSWPWAARLRHRVAFGPDVTITA